MIRFKCSDCPNAGRIAYSGPRPGIVWSCHTCLVFLGSYEPKDEECDWPSDDEESELAEDVKDKVKVEDDNKAAAKKEEDEDKPAKGVPEFWVTIFKNIEITQDMIQEHDEAALATLNDIKVTFSDGEGDTPMVRRRANHLSSYIHLQCVQHRFELCSTPSIFI